MVSRARDACQRRHILAHGNWQGFKSKAPLAVEIIWHMERGGTEIEQPHAIEMAWLNDLTSEIERLNNAVMQLSVGCGEIYRRRNAAGTL
jgi:hypothetical protein